MWHYALCRRLRGRATITRLLSAPFSRFVNGLRERLYGSIFSQGFLQLRERPEPGLPEPPQSFGTCNEELRRRLQQLRGPTLNGGCIFGRCSLLLCGLDLSNYETTVVVWARIDRPPQKLLQFVDLLAHRSCPFRVFSEKGCARIQSL